MKIAMNKKFIWFVLLLLIIAGVVFFFLKRQKEESEIDDNEEKIELNFEQKRLLASVTVCSFIVMAETNYFQKIIFRAICMTPSIILDKLRKFKYSQYIPEGIKEIYRDIITLEQYEASSGNNLKNICNNDLCACYQ